MIKEFYYIQRNCLLQIHNVQINKFLPTGIVIHLFRTRFLFRVVPDRVLFSQILQRGRKQVKIQLNLKHRLVFVDKEHLRNCEMYC